MNDSLFTFQRQKMSDDEFWQHLQEFDEVSESLPDFGGFSIKAKLSSGKDVNIPFVRFGKTITGKKV
jgi:hypothetical protein